MDTTKSRLWSGWQHISKIVPWYSWFQSPYDLNPAILCSVNTCFQRVYAINVRANSRLYHYKITFGINVTFVISAMPWLLLLLILSYRLLAYYSCIANKPSWFLFCSSGESCSLEHEVLWIISFHVYLWVSDHLSVREIFIDRNLWLHNHSRNSAKAHRVRNQLTSFLRYSNL